jgi:hypothetical protein
MLANAGGTKGVSLTSNKASFGEDGDSRNDWCISFDTFVIERKIAEGHVNICACVEEQGHKL